MCTNNSVEKDRGGAAEKHSIPEDSAGNIPRMQAVKHGAEKLADGRVCCALGPC